MPEGPITLFVADDNLLVREGVRAMLSREPDFEIVGVGEDYDSLVDGATAAAPQVIITDIRMPPNFSNEGIQAAKELRKRLPGLGVIVLSQYDDPEYVIGLLGEGTDGYGYLLKDRIAEGDQLARAVRGVATGQAVLDPKITDALVNPVRDEAGLTPAQEQLLQQVAQGRTAKAIAASTGSTPAAVEADIEELFVALAQGASAGMAAALRRLRQLRQAIVDREELGENLSRLLPSGLAERLRSQGRKIGETERLHVTVLMSDIRGYSTIAEHSDPSALASQLNAHRACMNVAIEGAHGTVMQYVGDAVLAVFGAPVAYEEHAQRALEAAQAMHAAQSALNTSWSAEGLSPFHLGLGLSTGEVAAALLGSEGRVEYSVVGDTVNLAARIQQWADPGETIISDATMRLLGDVAGAVELPPAKVKGREQDVRAFKLR